MPKGNEKPTTAATGVAAAPTAFSPDNPPPKLTIEESLKAAKAKGTLGRTVFDPRDPSALPNKVVDLPTAKVRYLPREGQDGQIGNRTGVERTAAPVQAESTLTKTAAMKLVRDGGGEAAAFERALEAGHIFGARFEENRWEIPESSVRTAIALMGGNGEAGLTFDENGGGEPDEDEPPVDDNSGGADTDGGGV